MPFIVRIVLASLEGAQDIVFVIYGREDLSVCSGVGILGMLCLEGKQATL